MEYPGLGQDSGPQRRIVSLLIVVGVRLYREGLAAALASEPGFLIVGDASDPWSARRSILQSRPDIVLLDMAMADSLSLVRDLKTEAPGTRVVAFAVAPSSSDIIACAEAGAAGYVTADASIDQLITAMTGVFQGELACPPSVAHDLFRRIGEAVPTPLATETPLTQREREILWLLRDGRSNKEIARTLKIAVSTVKNHVHHVLEKLQAPSRGEAALRALSDRTFHRQLRQDGAY